MTVLFLGGGQDVIADVLRVPISGVTICLQILALVGPPIAWYVTWRVCLTLRDRPGPERTERAGAVRRDPVGGYHDVEPHDVEPAEDRIPTGAVGE